MRHLKINERQFNMLKDVAGYNFKKYRYHAMPAEEVAVRDFRTMSALLRKGLVEYPTSIWRGMPQMDIYCVRITDLGIQALNLSRKDKMK